MTDKPTEIAEDANVFIGYHGTSKENVSLILKSNFKPSENPDDWLGYGVYFFVEGISDPKNNAKEYVVSKAWDNDNKALKYKYYSLLSATVTANNVLNTNDMESLKAFNEVSSLLQKKHKEIWKKGRDLTHDKRIIWNLVADFMSLEVIIHNLYIQTKEQRVQKITLNVPNTTVMCVKNTKNIDLKTIKEIGNGVVK